MEDTAQISSLPPLPLQRAREQLWNALTDTDPQTARQAYAAMMRTISASGALPSLQTVPRLRLFGVLFRASTILRAVRWVLYPALVAAGLKVNPWFLAGAPLVFLLDRAVLGYVQIRLGVALAARIQVFNDLTLENMQPFDPEAPLSPSEFLSLLDR